MEGKKWHLKKKLIVSTRTGCSSGSLGTADVVYLKMKNDVSFLMKDILNLYEHQSTFSPNLPLRGFLYFADLYRKVIGNQRDIYSSRLIPLPFPQFVVFYNGKQDEPERQVLSMSDAYPEGCVKSEASLQ